MADNKQTYLPVVIVHEPTATIITRVATVAEAEHWIEEKKKIDPDGVDAGDYGIDAPMADTTATATRRVGDEIYIRNTGSWSSSYRLGKIVKMLPSGMIDVDLGKDGSIAIVRFNPDGHERGATSRYRGYFLDELPFEERKAILAREAAFKAAITRLQDVELPHGLNANWQKEALSAEVDRIQAVLDDVRKLLAEVN